LRHAIDDNARIDQVPKFFDGARMNYAENFLCGEDDAVAIIEINEEIQKSPRKYTWEELKELVARYAGVLKREGATAGDVIVRECRFCLLGISFLMLCQSSEAITPDRSLSCLLQLRLVLCLRHSLQILVRRYVEFSEIAIHYLISCLTVTYRSSYPTQTQDHDRRTPI
jgi:hypothetical protein